MKLKVCGMREEENIRAVAALQPDYMGFIFYEKSKRFVGSGFEIAPDFPSNIKRVGVFVNESTDPILQLTDRHRLDFIQLHGEETVGQCVELKLHGCRVVKVFRIHDDLDWTTLRPYEDEVDFFLFDSPGADFGGNGVAFDWKILEEYNQQVPFFLSGGLSPQNSGTVKALKGMNIHALDINSGVEIKPGLKDVELIKEMKY